MTVGRAFTARLARRKAAPYVSHETGSTVSAALAVVGVMLPAPRQS